MINRINNTTNKAKPQPSPQVPPYPIIIVPPLDKRAKLGFIPCILTGSLYLKFLGINWAGAFEKKKRPQGRLPPAWTILILIICIGLLSKYNFTMLSCFVLGYHHIAIYLKILTTHSCYKYCSAKVNRGSTTCPSS